MNPIAALSTIRLPFGEFFGPTVPDRPVLLLLAALILFLMFNILLVLTVLYISNTYKNSKEKHIADYRNRYEETIRAYLFGEADWEATQRSLSRHLSRLNRKILISVLLEFQENLRGGADSRITEIFYRLGLYRDSLRSIKSSSYVKKINGLRELTNLYPEGAGERIGRLINHPNSLVRNEAQNSYMRLHPENPFDFMLTLHGDFTRWTQLSAFYLFRLHTLPVPEFGKYLDSSNPEVRNFCLRMIIFFQQIENASAIIRLMADPLESTRCLVLRAINDLRLYDARDLIRERYARETRRNRIEIIRALRNIGTGEDFGFLMEIIRTGTVTEKTEACRSLYFLNPEGPACLAALESEPGLEIGPFLAHITDPRN